jgi:hypothetical protein
MQDYSRQWICKIPQERLADFRNEESFHWLLALARVVNSLRFMHQSLLDYQDDDSPLGIRQRVNSFMYMGALLFEGIELSKRLRKHFRTTEGFSGFSSLHKDAAVESLLKDLRRLRNEAVFHFDTSTIAMSLGALSADEATFVRGSGFAQGNVYYELADATALQILTGTHQSSELSNERSKTVVKQVTDLSVRFVKAADELISLTLHSMDLWPEAVQ